MTSEKEPKKKKQKVEDQSNSQWKGDETTSLFHKVLTEGGLKFPQKRDDYFQGTTKLKNLSNLLHWTDL